METMDYKMRMMVKDGSLSEGAHKELAKTLARELKNGSIFDCDRDDRQRRRRARRRRRAVDALLMDDEKDGRSAIKPPVTPKRAREE